MTAMQTPKNPHIITVEGKKYIGVTHQVNGLDVMGGPNRCGNCALQADKVCAKNFDALNVPCGDKKFNTHYFADYVTQDDKMIILVKLVNDLVKNNAQKPRNIVVDDLNQNTNRTQPKKVVRSLTLAQAAHYNVLFHNGAEISEDIIGIMNSDKPDVMFSDASNIARKYGVAIQYVSYIYTAIKKANGIV